MGMNHVPDLAWCLPRLLPRGVLPVPNETIITSNQVIPFWSGFNHKLSPKKTSYTVVAYEPVVDTKPTDMATMYITMLKCTEMHAALGHHDAVQTMDQQLYTVAQQVKWTLPDELGGHVIRMGAFHTLSCFIACIGKSWGDAGLLDFLVDSVYAASTAHQIFAFKQLNLSLHIHS